MEPLRGWLYDGTTAARHEVEVSPAGAESLLIAAADGERREVPRASLFHVDTRAGWEVYGRTGVDGWRLGLAAADAKTLQALLPPRRKYGRWIDRIGLVRALVAAVLLSAAVIFVATRFPGWVAPYVPKSWEANFGRPVMAGLQGRFCNGPGGQEALRRLAATLSPQAASLDIRVVDIGIVNAAALPGDHILIFEALLRRAEGPDELAGVLAHEIAHIENRHVTEAMVRQFTFGLVVSLFGGGTGANLETLLQARYSRGAEAEADADAIAALRRAGISPLATAGFFGRVAEQERRLGALGRGRSYISTHPDSAERQRRFRESAGGRTDYKPALSREEWRALVDICRNDPALRG